MCWENKIDEETMNCIKLYTDGACRGNGTNNTVGGSGAVIFDTDGTIINEYRKYLGNGTTNNIAEYESLIMGLEGCIGYEKVSIYMDSKLVCNQVNGKWKVKNEKLKKLHEKVKQLLGNFVWDINHIPRDLNKDADRLANEAIDNVVTPRIIIPSGIQLWIYRKGIDEPFVKKFNALNEAIDSTINIMKDESYDALERGLKMNSRYMITNEDQEIIFDKKITIT